MYMKIMHTNACDRCTEFPFLLLLKSDRTEKAESAAGGIRFGTVIMRCVHVCNYIYGIAEKTGTLGGS